MTNNALLIGTVPTGPVSLKFFSDNFPDDPLAGRWTKVSGADASWTGGSFELNLTGPSQYVYTETLNTSKQWAYARIDAGFSAWGGLVVRSPGNTGNAYAFRRNGGGANNMTLRTIQGHTGVGDIFTWNRAHQGSDFLGIVVEQTGNATIFYLFDFGSTDPNFGPHQVNWFTLAEATQTVTVDPTQYADTGFQVGAYSGGGAIGIRNWHGGDWDTLIT